MQRSYFGTWCTYRARLAARFEEAEAIYARLNGAPAAHNLRFVREISGDLVRTTDMLRTLVTRFRYISLRVVFNTVYPTTLAFFFPFPFFLSFLITGIRGGNKERDSSSTNYTSFLPYSRSYVIGYIVSGNNGFNPPWKSTVEIQNDFGDFVPIYASILAVSHSDPCLGDIRRYSCEEGARDEEGMAEITAKGQTQ